MTQFRNREELKRLMAALITHPKIKSLGIKPSPKRMALFFQEKAVFGEIVRYLDIIENGVQPKAQKSKIGKSWLDLWNFERLLDLATLIADDAPKSALEKLSEIYPGRPPSFRNANLWRGDISTAVPLTETCWHQFISLFYYELRPESRYDFESFQTVMKRLEDLFKSAKRVNAAGSKIYLLAKNGRKEIECFDDEAAGLRFVILKSIPKHLMTVTKPEKLRRVAWAKDGQIIDSILAIPDHRIPPWVIKR